MSAFAIYVVRCDWDTCRETVVGNTAWEARDAARVIGWQTGRNINSKDRCRTHREWESKP